MRDWKKLSHQIHQSIDEKGGTCISLDQPERLEGDTVLLIRSTMRITTRDDMTPKGIRRYFWEMRENRTLNREGTMFWAVFDPNSDVVYIGLGAPLQPQQVERAELLMPDQIWRRG